MIKPLPKTATVVRVLLALSVVATGCSTLGPVGGAAEATVVDVGEPGLGPDDGYIESKALSPFADDQPAIANLDPELRQAMQDAATAAMGDGVDFVVTSGWRSAYYQQSLLDDAVRDYGSAEAAGEFVLSPTKSKHVLGQAVDIGFTDANSWLSQHGADYGLCQIYANEMWHFELATERGGQCPDQLTDASAG